MRSLTNYFDIDAILAEEELVPCRSNFDFTHLAHLDVESKEQLVLPQGTSLKLPLWALEKWAPLGFVTLAVPRHFGRKARERLDADSTIDLRRRSELFFMAGSLLTQLMEACAYAKKKQVSGRKARQRTEDLFQDEADGIRRTLMYTYAGHRLRRTLDWSLSSVGEDVSHYTEQLTELERLLFQQSSTAAIAYVEWKTFGHTPLPQPSAQTGAREQNPKQDENSADATSANVTTGPDDREGKRQKTA